MRNLENKAFDLIHPPKICVRESGLSFAIRFVKAKEKLLKGSGVI
jgi:hypothetical protein